MASVLTAENSFLSQRKDSSYLETLVLKKMSNVRDPKIQINDVPRGLPTSTELKFFIILTGRIYTVSGNCTPVLPSVKSEEVLSLIHFTYITDSQLRFCINPQAISIW